MGIIASALSALSAVGKVAGAVKTALGMKRDKILREEGEQRAENTGLRKNLERIEDAHIAGDSVDVNPNKLREPDPDSRD